jgi:hypothetical protein
MGRVYSSHHYARIFVWTHTNAQLFSYLQSDLPMGFIVVFVNENSYTRHCTAREGGTAAPCSKMNKLTNK